MAGPLITFQLTGQPELDRRFQELPKRLQKKVLREALRPAAKLVHQQAQANIPSKSGRARGSLKVRAGKRSRKFPDRVALVVITAAGWFRGESFYVSFGELGFQLGSRKVHQTKAGPRHKLGLRYVRERRPVKGRHWIKRALQTARSAATALAMQKIREGIEREAKALGGPNGRTVAS